MHTAYTTFCRSCMNSNIMHYTFGFIVGICVSHLENIMEGFQCMAKKGGEIMNSMMEEGKNVMNSVVKAYDEFWSSDYPDTVDPNFDNIPCVNTTAGSKKRSRSDEDDENEENDEPVSKKQKTSEINLREANDCIPVNNVQSNTLRITLEDGSIHVPRNVNTRNIYFQSVKNMVHSMPFVSFRTNCKNTAFIIVFQTEDDAMNAYDTYNNKILANCCAMKVMKDNYSKKQWAEFQQEMKITFITNTDTFVSDETSSDDESQHDEDESFYEKVKHTKWCYNCEKTGHFNDECTEPQEKFTTDSNQYCNNTGYWHGLMNDFDKNVIS